MSVVDYIISPVESFKALQVTLELLIHAKIVTDNNMPLDSSMPDHRILTVNLTLNGLPSNTHRRVRAPEKIKTTLEDYMLDSSTLDRLDTLVRELKCSTSSICIRSL